MNGPRRYAERGRVPRALQLREHVREFSIAARVGFNAEWADPAWGGQSRGEEHDHPQRRRRRGGRRAAPGTRRACTSTKGPSHDRDRRHVPRPELGRDRRLQERRHERVRREHVPGGLPGRRRSRTRTWTARDPIASEAGVRLGAPAPADRGAACDAAAGDERVAYVRRPGSKLARRGNGSYSQWAMTWTTPPAVNAIVAAGPGAVGPVDRDEDHEEDEAERRTPPPRRRTSEAAAGCRARRSRRPSSRCSRSPRAPGGGRPRPSPRSAHRTAAGGPPCRAPSRSPSRGS